MSELNFRNFIHKPLSNDTQKIIIFNGWYSGPYPFQRIVLWILRYVINHISAN